MASIEDAQETGTDLGLTLTAETYCQRKRVHFVANKPRKAAHLVLPKAHDKSVPFPMEPSDFQLKTTWMDDARYWCLPEG